MAYPQMIPNEVACQVDFRPNPRVIDRRGDWAALLSDEFSFAHWSVGQDAIQLADGDKTRTMQVSFRRFWLGFYKAASRDVLPNEANRVLSRLFALEGFGATIKVGRIGVRSRFFTAFEAGFDDLLKRYRDRFSDVKPGIVEQHFGTSARLTDAGSPYELDTPSGSIKFMCGPMLREQARRVEYFGEGRPAEDFPSAGLYFDIDYYRQFGEGDEAFDGSKIMEIIQKFAADSWETHWSIRKLITR